MTDASSPTPSEQTPTEQTPTSEPSKQVWSINSAQLQEIVSANKNSWLIAGVVLALLGAVCIGMPFAAGVWTITLLGIVLIISGISTVIHAFKSRGWAGFTVQLLLGTVYAAVGVLLAINPLEGMVAVTLIIGAFLLVDGITRLFLALRVRKMPGSKWLLGGGVLSILLGLIIVSGWPGDSTWVLGLFIGIDLLMLGITLIGIASAVGQAAKAEPGETEPA